ncbi:RadC family protein [Plasticicumulans acidivorans]|uniref:DNA replication and repair protein RadC n=1 Tax=Plasticicumulans acidivorans TaxID=886464 RepID=A0A317MXZ0_9GAMM|nr:DNA repair protein RadC [Plasticicumulans acidivorans]PWV64520.1 DNA replication and repair protein RadC [Plasticicumulans acidivorans]
MSIRDWPESERPREKLLERGPHALSDAELLAIFLRTGLPGRSAVDLARDLLSEFGGLRPLLEADLARFSRGPGLGTAKYVQLQAVMELARRHMEAELCRGETFSSVSATRRYLSARLRHQPHEVFAVLFLDTRHRMIAYEELFFGTIDGTSVHPRQVVKRALHHNAAAVILAHNHPSGVAEPSLADETITQRLRDALALVDVRVLDHCIIGDTQVTSFAERGLL